MRRWLFILAIIAAIGQTALAAGPIEPTTGRWISIGNGPSHSGSYPATLGSGSITPGWSKAFGRGMNPVAVSDGRVFVTTTGMPVTEANRYGFAVALNAESGAELWRVVLPTTTDAPIVNGGNVLVEAEPQWAVYALGATDGSVKWIHPFDGIVRTAAAPTAGDHVWLSFGTGGVLGVRISDNILQSVVPFVEGDRSIGASYYAGVLYVTDGNLFEAIDPETGAVQWTLPTSLGSIFFYNIVIPAIAKGKAACISADLTTIDLQSHSVLWKVSSPSHTGLAATDGSAVYALSGDPYTAPTSIRAYNADTGSLLGVYPLTGITGTERFDAPPQPLVTNDTVLVATDQATYIFDKASFTLRTRLPVGGHLSYAAGTLYLVDSCRGSPYLCL